ncbi:MAG TPA: DNA polymerase III subunit gamma/tau [Pirellulales bacterium]|nr:DNA polymerase III subunit gamma/tau [Pirellulales bacterium]
MSATSGGGADPGTRGDSYVVVARRYRPQTFADLVGQEHVAQALAGAITSNRVGHAYLFTGARGVGKTSAARIFAKALNCVHGPTPTPCNECDICRAISTGDDVDVLEIDGASNRGIDEIRELRQNVNVRASRSRYKIYIIDEVHMLTREAFNALLKTLEEPPEHVKFIFCTTEPEKIPITILSRCQRFDFAGIQTPSIVARLRQIVEAEGTTAEPEALEIIARRAAGSMRDSQSLLEQLMASGGERLTAADVNRLLGTAGTQRLGGLVAHLASGDAAAALADLDAALAEGVDVGQLLDQLLGYLRDTMVAAVGCPADALEFVDPAEAEQVAAIAEQLGLETILAWMQVIDSSLARMRYTTRGRTLAELALVRLARLGNLEELARVVEQLRTGAPTAAVPKRPALPAATPVRQVAAPSPAATKKKAGDSVVSSTVISESADTEVELTTESAEEDGAGVLSPTVLWSQVLAQQTGVAHDMAEAAIPRAILAPNLLVVAFPAGYTSHKSFCERPEQVAKFEQSLRNIVGRPMRIEFVVAEAEQNAEAKPAAAPTMTDRDRMMQAAEQPLVKRATELFGARPVRLEAATGVTPS